MTYEREEGVSESERAEDEKWKMSKKKTRKLNDGKMMKLHEIQTLCSVRVFKQLSVRLNL